MIVIVVVTSRSKEGIMAVQQGIFLFSLIAPSPPTLMGVAPPSSLAREAVAAVVVAVAVVASAGAVFNSSDGIHIVPKIMLEDGTDANKPLKKTNVRAFDPASWRQLDLRGKLVRWGGVL